MHQRLVKIYPHPQSTYPMLRGLEHARQRLPCARGKMPVGAEAKESDSSVPLRVPQREAVQGARRSAGRYLNLYGSIAALQLLLALCTLSTSLLE